MWRIDTDLDVTVLIKFCSAIKTTRRTKAVYNSHNEIQSYHNKEVTLSKSEQNEMRRHRKANRKRLKDGLKIDNKPQPVNFQSQGSYAHRTMIQYKDKDYDIDDGVYFSRDDLKNKKGRDKNARDAKEMVRKAVHRSRLKHSPEIRTNCVRIHYDAGYHVDIPVYREIKTGKEEPYYEIASTSWKKSDPVAVNRWFEKKSKRRGSSEENRQQLCRLIRLLKAFARSRKKWRTRIASGFMITILIVEECYRAHPGRDDKALYETMVAMRDRLKFNLKIKHPTMKGEILTSGPDDAKTGFLQKQLNQAIDDLAILFNLNCDRKQALKAWDKVFNTNFFGSLLDGKKQPNRRV